MRKLEFRTEAVLEAEGGIAQFCTAFDAVADLAVILTRREANSLSILLEEIIKTEDKEFVYFTLRGAGRGIRSQDATD